MKPIALILTGMFIFGSCAEKPSAAETTELQNPILPGYFADPSLVRHDGKFYIYVTADPWGTDFLSCWESGDFRDWTFNKLNWPTKEACTSPTSRSSKVWAPSVIEKDGMFYMYISVGSEIWCGKAAHPLGPWENMLGDSPMIPDDPTEYYHVIDAEAFIDDDGRAYLYWGSGWNWTNGHCFVAELNDDMSTFKTEPKEVTPTRYFEGPFMMKHNGTYYLTYSEGKTIDETYEVRYAVGDNPAGPFTEARNSPVLTMNDSLKVYGPGHHTIFTYEGRHYMLYHRHRLPFVKGEAFRQTCVNEFTFNDSRNEINTIIPFHTQSFPALGADTKKYIVPESASASSSSAGSASAANVLDNSYATRWEASADDTAPSVTVSFGQEVHIGTAEIRFEYPWKEYFIKLEASEDGEQWKAIADHTGTGVSGSPVDIAVGQKCRHIRISFALPDKETTPSVWELRFY